MKSPVITVVDDFLPNPDEVRRLALSVPYIGSEYHKGVRSVNRFHELIAPKHFERLLGGLTIPNWDLHGMNGRFQLCTPTDPIVYHADFQSHAATIYLTPDAPVDSGLSLYKSRYNGRRRASDDAETNQHMFGDFYDGSRWELVDRIGNIYNRLVIFDARLVHAATAYFGNGITDGRLFWMFFFDAEPPKELTL